MATSTLRHTFSLRFRSPRPPDVPAFAHVPNEIGGRSGGGVSDRITVLGVPCERKSRSRNYVVALLMCCDPGLRNGTTRHGRQWSVSRSRKTSTKTILP
jgi:hypothetical protein